MRPEDYQPRITAWGHVYRLLLMLALSAMAWIPRLDYQFHHVRWWFVTDLAVGLVSYLVVTQRRRFPVTVTTVTNLAGMISFTAAGPGALSLVSLSTRRRWREILPMTLLTLAVAIFAEWVLRVPEVPTPNVFEAGALVALICLMVAVGLYIGSRRELLASWQSRARLAEAEQEAKVREARAAERSRIAREMHDVLAHRISTANMYAGALAYRADLTPDEVQQTATVIADTSRQALTELREVLGVLREGPGDAIPERPQDASVDLVELIEENRASGMRIAYDVEADDLPPALARTLYRCLQEGLTNARKHAPSALVRVAVSGSEADGVRLRVCNGLAPRSAVDPAPPESGFGLVGLAERVKLSGGEQSAGVGPDGKFELTVWLPWQT